MSRTRLVVLLVLTVLVGGGTQAFAQQAEGPYKAPGEPDCAAEACEEAPKAGADGTEPAQEEPAAEEATVEPASEPAVEEEVVVDEAAVAEPVAPETDRSVSTSTAERAAMVLADATVDIVDFDYEPGSVTITAGDTITWTQSGDAPHTVTADDGSFDSGEMATGETFSMRFDSPGTYRYYCTLHGGPGGEGMSAVVTVEGGEGGEEPPSVNPDGEDEGNGSAEGPKGDDAAPTTDGALPRTGGGPPPAWVFAIALVIMGYVLSKVARLSERAARG